MVRLEQARQSIKVLDLLDQTIEGQRNWSFTGMDSRLKAIILKATEPRVADRYAARSGARSSIVFTDKAVTALKSLS